MARGGHFLSGQTLPDTVAVNMMFKRTVLLPTNAFNNSVLQVVVARRVLSIVQRWEAELQIYCRRRDRVRWAGNTEELPSPSGDDANTSSNEKACEWFALLFLIRSIAPTKLDSSSNMLVYTHDHLEAAILKAVLFVEFWSKRTRSTKFSVSIKSALGEFMAYARMTESEVDRLPTLWQPGPGEDYPPSLESYLGPQVRSV